MSEAKLPTVVLFGSAARGDNDPCSDIDILILEDSSYPKSIKDGKIELQKLSKADAIRKAEAGDLFMLHVVHEGLVISDPERFFPKLRESLQIKHDYLRERTEALLLAAFISQNWGHFKDLNLLNKRISWSVRTILISRLVESGRIVFSPAGLAASAPNIDVSQLIQLRRSSSSPHDLIPLLRAFVGELGGREYLKLSKAEFARKFRDLGKSVALSTFSKMLSNADDFSY